MAGSPLVVCGEAVWLILVLCYMSCHKVVEPESNVAGEQCRYAERMNVYWVFGEMTWMEQQQRSVTRMDNGHMLDRVLLQLRSFPER